MSMLNGNSRFSVAPQASIERSRFDRSHSHKTTFDAGKLVPIYCEEVLPGDTVTMDLSTVCRMSTPMYPVMDNAYMDVHWFFVPYHLLGLGISVGQKGRRKVSSVNIFYAIHVDHSRNPPLMVIGRTLTALVLSAVVAKTLRSLLTRTGVRFLLIIVLLIG